MAEGRAEAWATLPQAVEDEDEETEESDINTCQRDVLEMLLAIYDKRTMRPDLEEWYNTLKQINTNYYSDAVKGETRRAMTIPLKQLKLLLRECVLTNRWSEAATVLSTIIESPVSCRQTTLRVMTELLHHIPPENHDCFKKFLTQIGRQRFVNGSEAAIEYGLYLCMIGKLDSALKATSEIPGRKYGPRKVSRQDVLAKKQYFAMRGILQYCEFLKLKGDIDIVDPNYKDVYNLAEAKATQVTEDLEKSRYGEESSISWDYCITALVEVLEFSGNHAKALEVLERYARNVPHNPNAYRYLMEYHKRHGNNDKELEYMQKFCDAVPSEHMVLELYERLVAKGSPASETLHLLFDLLDYGVWVGQSEPWTLLANHLSKLIKSDGPNKRLIHCCWAIRKSWWPSYHFNITADECISVVIDKARVAAILMGPDNAFVQEVSQLEDDSKKMKRLRKLIRRHHSINVN